MINHEMSMLTFKECQTILFSFDFEYINLNKCVINVGVLCYTLLYALFDDNCWLIILADVNSSQW